MNFLLDTNAVSEWMKPKPNVGLSRWLEQVDEYRLYLSAVTIAELRYGSERLAGGARRNRLEQWLREDLTLRFEGRILPIDVEVADRAGRLVARLEAVGRPVEAIDAFIAATAEAHDLILVTRNVSDFVGVQERVLNPWS